MQPYFDNSGVGTSSVESGSSDGLPSERFNPYASVPRDSSPRDSGVEADLPSSRFVWTLRALCAAGLFEFFVFGIHRLALARSLAAAAEM